MSSLHCIFQALVQRALSDSKEILDNSEISDHSFVTSPELPQSCDYVQRSHDHSSLSHDLSTRSHDHSRRSHGHSALSHDLSTRSHDHSRRSHGHSALSHDLSTRLHDQSQKSHDQSALSHDHSYHERSPVVNEEQQKYETEEDRAVKYGPYNENYSTLHTIGKGAFGFVKIAERISDKEKVRKPVSEK